MSSDVRMTDEKRNDLMRRCRTEYRTDFILPVHLDLTALLALVGNLHLALRHPANIGPSAKSIRSIVDAIIERLGQEGFPAHAELMRLGDNPAYDEPAKDRSN